VRERKLLHRSAKLRDESSSLEVAEDDLSEILDIVRS
jgi:hypothetical protein